MPKIFQGLLMSATLSPELDKFKRVLLHNPAVLRLEVREWITFIMKTIAWNLGWIRERYFYGQIWQSGYLFSALKLYIYHQMCIENPHVANNTDSINNLCNKLNRNLDYLISADWKLIHWHHLILYTGGKRSWSTSSILSHSYGKW